MHGTLEWREAVESRASPELRRGFDLLNLDGGNGWEFLLSMMWYKGRQRISAKGALAHPYLDSQGHQNEAHTGRHIHVLHSDGLLKIFQVFVNECEQGWAP